MRAGEETPDVLMDLRHLRLSGIVEAKDHISMGACVTHREIRDSDLIAKHLPGLTQATAQMAGPPVRNRGTLGGNLVTASPAADTAPPLLAYDASVVLRSAEGERRVPLEQFFVGPGQTVLGPSELLVEVLVPRPPDRTRCQFMKLGRRRAMAISVASVAARLTLDKNGEVECARIALGSVAPTPIRAREAERQLVGRVVSLELAAETGQTASEECSPISDIRASCDYRRKMVRVLVRRALWQAWRCLEGADDDK
jgi:CO/xanthine dehydrogenase FAD-binding subunit